MSPELLLLLAILQGGIVVLLFGLLLWNRAARSLIDRRYQRQRHEMAETLLRWHWGDADVDAVTDVFSGVTLRAARAALEDVWASMSPDERDVLVQIVRPTRWFRKVYRQADAIFWWKRMDAAQLLGYLGRQEDVEVLGRLVGDHHPAVKIAAVFAARRLVLSELLHPLLDEAVVAEPVRRKTLEDALLAYGDRIVEPLLERLADAEEEDELVTCLSLAGQLGRRTSTPRLAGPVMARASDDRLEVRIAAVRALSAFEDDGVPVHRTLRDALDDEAWQVRAQAAGALGVLEVQAAAGDLQRALRDASWWVRLRAAIALRQLGEPGRRLLEAVDSREDPFAYDMSRYVLRLDDPVVAEYAP